MVVQMQELHIRKEGTMTEVKTVMLSPCFIKVDGMKIFNGSINDAYRTLINDYPKFFKMDGLCKIGFLGAELLLRCIASEDKENAAIILFGRVGSLSTDRNYRKTISNLNNYFPSPALFVYTLANIVTGEIAIRHKIYGETSFYITEENDPQMMETVIKSVFETSNPSLILAGWVDYETENNYLAELKIVRNQKQS